MTFLVQLTALLKDNPWPAFTAILIVANIWQFIALARERKAHLETARSVVPIAEQITNMVQAAANASRMRKSELGTSSSSSQKTLVEAR